MAVTDREGTYESALTGQAVGSAQPRGPTTTNDIRTEQQAIKEQINDPTVARLLAATPQVARPSANDPAFQPNPGGLAEHPRFGSPGHSSDDWSYGVAGGQAATDLPAPAPTRLVGDMVSGAPKAPAGPDAVVNGGDIMVSGSPSPSPSTWPGLNGLNP